MPLRLTARSEERPDLAVKAVTVARTRDASEAKRRLRAEGYDPDRIKHRYLR
ncbi:hypothetical protein ABIA35_008934 [Catenulispora sp. MAP12-49]